MLRHTLIGPKHPAIAIDGFNPNQARGRVISSDLKSLTILGECWNCHAKRQNETIRMTLGGFEGEEGKVDGGGGARNPHRSPHEG